MQKKLGLFFKNRDLTKKLLNNYEYFYCKGLEEDLFAVRNGYK